MKSQRILLLSAYDARSHRYWHQQLIDQFPEHQWQVLSLQDRYFSWRMGGNALSFKAKFHQQLSKQYDLLLATSMTDLAAVRSFYPNLSLIPNLLYFHENQFAYPENIQQQGLVEIQLRSIVSAMSADKLAFNSAYNRDTFYSGVQAFLQQMPDGIPVDLIGQLKQKTTLLPVPLKSDCTPDKGQKQHTSEEIHVVWNHRWEHDKGPETLLHLLQMTQNQPHIKYHIIGQQFRNHPQTLQQVSEKHPAQCLTLGYVQSREQYIRILQSADIVLSTARHDFQGIAMLEGVACGCKPIAPDHLVYPELYPPENLYKSNPTQAHNEAKSILDLIVHQHLLSQPENLMNWKNLKAAYSNWLSV